MAGVAHTPHREKRPSGYFFRRRLPKAWVEISNPGQSSALCISLGTDVLSEAKILVARLTALTDAAFALTTERPVDHLTLDETTSDWRALAFEALRVMLDVSHEREKREVGTYEEVTPSWTARQSSGPWPVTRPCRMPPA